MFSIIQSLRVSVLYYKDLTKQRLSVTHKYIFGKMLKWNMLLEAKKESDTNCSIQGFNKNKEKRLHKHI